MRVLFVGESWLGSCARTLKEALARRSDVVVDECNEDLFFPRARQRLLRIANRLAYSAYAKVFREHLLSLVADSRPDVVMVYKGQAVSGSLIRAIKSMGALTVNIYPDCSPHAHGRDHREAVGTYDLVISSKRYHPPAWRELYGYSNHCVHVPQGYDPLLHLVPEPPQAQDYDIVMVASRRPQYADLMQGLAQHLAGQRLRVALGGANWEAHRGELPDGWEPIGGVLGRSYVRWLRRGRICIAPVTRTMMVDGVRHPGDVDSTRTYELAAAHCFFVHMRTDLVSELYDERSEVPMFEDAVELASHIRRFIDDPTSRMNFAREAHLRAVPAYSIDLRAKEIVEHVRSHAHG